MTIKEKFAKYTIQEIEDGIARLETKIQAVKEEMETAKANRNVEFYRAANDAYDDLMFKLMDAEAALVGRRKNFG